MTSVCVLGCGPAGLLAAHAATQYGAEVRILSKKEKSNIGGAQLLHRAIPEITDDKPDALCDIAHKGTREAYAKKVYGNPDADVSWGTYPEGLNSIWNMQRAYNILWQRYEDRIIEQDIRPMDLYGYDYDLLVSCAPAKVLCVAGHELVGQDVWIMPGDFPLYSKQDCSIVYNGWSAAMWHRWSHLFGNSFYEYPVERHNARKINKPLWTDCDCHEDRLPLLKVGRYGKWEKHQLTHHAYEGVLDAMYKL